MNTKEIEMTSQERERIAGLMADKQARIARAQTLRAEGQSLFEIAQRLGVTKEWLREYAGLR